MEELKTVSEEQMEGLKIVTESGFECTVKEDALGDMRVFDALVKVESKRTEPVTRAVKLVELMDMLLGEEQKEDLYDFLAERDGEVRSPAVMQMVKEILSKVSEAKKK